MDKLKKTNTSPKYSVKDIDTGGRVISVYAAAFDNLDRDGDVIVKGAMKKTVQEQGPAGIKEIWHILYHNPDLPVATPFELTEDSYGLLARVKMPNTDRGNETLQLYIDGHYKHQSIGYKTIKSQKKNGYNELQELKLFEFSTVLWAANPAAISVGVKSMDKAEIAQELEITLKGLRDGRYHDDTFLFFEKKIKTLMDAASQFDIIPPNEEVEPVEKPEEKAQKEADEKKLKSLISLF